MQQHGNVIPMASISKRALKAPQHWHAQVCTYDSWDEQKAMPIGKHCDVTLVTNDNKLAIHLGKEESELPNGHLANSIQCSDPQHLEGIEMEKKN